MEVQLDRTDTHKRSTFKIDGETASRLEYLKRVYSEALQVKGYVSQSVIMKRAIEFYSEFMPSFLRMSAGYDLKEKSSIKRLKKYNPSPIMVINSIIDPETDRLATYSGVVKMESERIQEQLREMNAGKEMVINA